MGSGPENEFIQSLSPFPVDLTPLQDAALTWEFGFAFALYLLNSGASGTILTRDSMKYKMKHRWQCLGLFGCCQAAAVVRKGISQE